MCQLNVQLHNNFVPCSYNECKMWKSINTPKSSILITRIHVFKHIQVHFHAQFQQYSFSQFSKIIPLVKLLQHHMFRNSNHGVNSIWWEHPLQSFVVASLLRSHHHMHSIIVFSMLPSSSKEKYQVYRGTSLIWAVSTVDILEMSVSYS